MLPANEMAHQFAFLDYVVFALMLSVSAAIGIYHGRKGQDSAMSILLGGKSIGVFPIAVSVTATFMSSIGLLGWPAEIYMYGTQYNSVHLVFAMPLAILLCHHFFIPVFYNLGVTSSFEYLELRFGRSLRTLGCFIYCTNTVFYMGIVLYGPALALSQVTGIEMWTTILTTGTVCTFYTTIGGIKAVVWTDVFQIFVIMGSLIYVIIHGLMESGSVKKVIMDNLESGRLEMFNFDPDPTVRCTFLNVLLGGTLTWILFYGVNQSAVQRYNTLKSLKSARNCIWIVLVNKIIIYFIIIICGMVIYSKYQGCDPITTRKVTAADQLFPLFVMDTLGGTPGIAGLFVAGVFSASLSTLSSGINSMTAVVLEDIIKPYICADIKDRTSSTILKVLAAAFGALAIGSVLIADYLGNIIDSTNTIFGLIWSPMIGLFVLGMFFPRVNSKHATVAIVCGFALNLWMGIGNMIYKPFHAKKPISVDHCENQYFNSNRSFFLNETSDLNAQMKANNDNIFYLYRISFMYYNFIGVASTIIIGYICSLLFHKAQKLKMEDLDLYVPFIKEKLATRTKTKTETVEMTDGIYTKRTPV